MSFPLTTSREYSFQGQIWSLQVDQETGLLAVEVRNPGHLQVSFSVIDPTQAPPVLDHYQLPESWWLGMAAFSAGVLYLQGYTQMQQLGVPQGVTALNVISRQILFSHPNLQWSGLATEAILLSSAPGVSKRYHPIKGTLLPSESLGKEIEEVAVKRQERRWVVPEVYEPGTVYYENLVNFLQEKTGQEPEAEISYLETDNMFCLGYGSKKEDGTIINFLVTYTLAGNQIGFFPLASGALGSREPAFSVVDNCLVLIQEDTKLVCVSFPESVL